MGNIHLTPKKVVKECLRHKEKTQKKKRKMTGKSSYVRAYMQAG